MFQNTLTKVDASVSTDEQRTNDALTTADLTRVDACVHRRTSTDLRCFDFNYGIDRCVCCLHTDRDQVRYGCQSINEDYKLGILKCWYLQPVFVFPLSCSHNVCKRYTATVCSKMCNFTRRLIITIINAEY
jgi:hypothetical protein